MVAISTSRTRFAPGGAGNTSWSGTRTMRTSRSWASPGAWLSRTAATAARRCMAAVRSLLDGRRVLLVLLRVLLARLEALQFRAQPLLHRHRRAVLSPHSVRGAGLGRLAGDVVDECVDAERALLRSEPRDQELRSHRAGVVGAFAHERVLARRDRVDQLRDAIGNEARGGAHGQLGEVFADQE